MKKGQITFYMIIIVVALILLGLAYFVSTRSATVEIAQVEVQSMQEVKLGANGQVQSCLDLTLKEGLEKLGKNAGFLYLPPDAEFQYTDEHKFVVLYRNKQSFLPSLGQMQRELQRYVSENVRYCIDDFLKYKQQGWDIKQQNPQTQITFDETKVSTTMHFPAVFSKQGSSFSLESFRAEEQVPLLSIVKEVEDIIAAASGVQKGIDAAKKTLEDADPSNDRLPHNPVPPASFIKNEVDFQNFHYPGTGRFLWVAKKDNFAFKYGVNIEI